jgi:carbon storage regulator CsrA
MLTLSRKAGESLIIDPDGLNIRVKFQGMRNGEGRIGIEAPKHVLVLREELLEPAKENDECQRRY